MLAKSTEAQGKTTLPLAVLFFTYLRIGLTAFGPAILSETKTHIVERNKWISEQEFLNGLALGQLLPGASLCSMTVYIGYQLRGISGGAVCLLGLLLPAFLIMIGLSYLFFQYGELPLVNNLLQGVLAMVVALVANALVVVGKSAVNNVRGAIIAILAFFFMIYYPHIFLILLTSAITGLILFYPSLRQQSHPAAGVLAAASRPPASRLWRIGSILAATLILFYCLASLRPKLLQLGWVFFRMGALVFGNGFTMIPLIQQEVVTKYHWLNLDEFAVGLVLGQMTPGPILITATFVGYRVAGLLGAVASTIGMFLPSYLLVLLTAEIHEKIRHNPWVKSAFSGLVASFVGMMLVVVYGMAKHGLVDIKTTGLAILAFILVRFAKIDVIWIILGGMALYWLLTLI